VRFETIEKLILAHEIGSEVLFGTAIAELVSDEEKKGNLELAQKIRSAYLGRNRNGKKTTKNLDFALESSYNDIPQDKENELELYEFVTTITELSDVILPANQLELLKQVLAEAAMNDELIKKNLPPANRLLLCGPPGCGKSMTAYAVAHELKLPLAYVRLDGLVSSYLGQTSVNLRKVFDSVNNQKLVLFLDEFDAIAKKRDDSHEMGELKRVVTALLQNFDNLSPSVFLIAATNHEHLLDPAIWRRFNYTVKLDLPKEEQREFLIRKWFDDYAIEHEADLWELTTMTEGMTPAGIKELILTAAKRQVTTGTGITTTEMKRLLSRQLTNHAE